MLFSWILSNKESQWGGIIFFAWWNNYGPPLWNADFTYVDITLHTFVVIDGYFLLGEASNVTVALYC